MVQSACVVQEITDYATQQVSTTSSRARSCALSDN